jgi:hypothetical protein
VRDKIISLPFVLSKCTNVLGTITFTQSLTYKTMVTMQTVTMLLLTGFRIVRTSTKYGSRFCNKRHRSERVMTLTVQVIVIQSTITSTSTWYWYLTCINKSEHGMLIQYSSITNTSTSTVSDTCVSH